jgi:hypothetical protein
MAAQMSWELDWAAALEPSLSETGEAHVSAFSFRLSRALLYFSSAVKDNGRHR